MLIKPYGDIIKGDEDPLKKSHIGVVVDNNDPEKLDRVKVHLDMWDHLTTEQLDWVRPKKECFLGGSPNSAKHYIPELGDEVRVTFPNGDERDPQYEGVEVNEGNKCTLFDEDYPHTYGEKDSVGNFTMTNRRTKIMVHKFASGTTVQADPDGSVSVFTEDNLTYIRLDGDGTITLKGAKINIVGTDEVNIDSTKVSIKASNTLDMSADISKLISNTKTIVGGTQTSIEAVNSVALMAPSVVSQNLEVLGAPTGTVFDLTSKEVYVITSGIVTSKLGG